MRLKTLGLLWLVFMVAGCGSAISDPAEPASRPATSPETVDPNPPDRPPVLSPTGEETAVLPPPQNQLSDQEYSWSQLLPRDGILPIYDPQFAPAAEAPYDDSELVIGVEINGQAKAYAIGPLNSREMVNDTLGGVPILVTW